MHRHADERFRPLLPVPLSAMLYDSIMHAHCTSKTKFSLSKIKFMLLGGPAPCLQEYENSRVSNQDSHVYTDQEGNARADHTDAYL